jgi:anthranilate phosphoribosyltransferase
LSDEAVVQVLRELSSRSRVLSETCEAAFRAILDGQTTESRTAALLTAIHLTGERPDLLVGAVRAVRSRMVPFPIPDHLRPVLDTCGTGGDGVCSFNISTAVAIVCAAAGVRVAKHGNRSASGNSGSAEVLTSLGVAIDQPEPVLLRCLEELGIVFLFAPRFHPALGPLAAVRRQLPFRTLFNLVGPLVNPARPEHQLVGVPTPEAHALYAAVWRPLGMGGRRSAIVHGLDGLDEVSLAAPTQVSWRPDGGEETWTPDGLGLLAVAPEALRVSGPDESAERMRAIFRGDRGPLRDVVLANAAAAFRVVERSASLAEGVALAAETIDSGRAADHLERWRAISQARG